MVGLFDYWMGDCDAGKVCGRFVLGDSRQAGLTPRLMLCFFDLTGGLLGTFLELTLCMNLVFFFHLFSWLVLLAMHWKRVREYAFCRFAREWRSVHDLVLFLLLSTGLGIVLVLACDIDQNIGDAFEKFKKHTPSRFKGCTAIPKISS